MAKGRKTGGRTAGTPNKVTADTRQFFAGFAERNFPKLEDLIDRAGLIDPAKAADLILKAAEYHVPKLSRAEHTGKDGERLPDPPIFVLQR